jgi:hypothetical protein
VIEGAVPWGRVAEDGTVYVRTAAGERAVGSFPGASTTEALAYFTRKFDALEGQVRLLEQRVRTTDLAAKDAFATISKLKSEIASASAVGDLDGLAARLDALAPVIEEHRAEHEAARQRMRLAAREAKELIVEEAERVSVSTSWKVAGDRLKALLDEWKQAPRLDRRTDDELWKRFSAARTSFDKRRRQHFAELDSQRDEARARKEKLVAEAEGLADSTDWGATAARYREMMREWKNAGRASRAEEDALWARFRGAQDVFFKARDAVFAKRDEGHRDNLGRKEALVREAERLLPITDPKSARARLRKIHERWESVGHVPRGDRERIEARLRKVEEAVRSAEESEWRRTNPEARARAEATVSQLVSSIDTLAAQADGARKAGRDDKAAELDAAVAARREWLAEARKTLADFSR